jgi:hypothetical protein
MPTRDEFLADLTVFSDLGTAPAVVEDVSTHIRVEWIRQDMQRIVQVDHPGTERCVVSVNDRVPTTYAEFLASPVMGDLGRLATKIRLLRGVVRNRSAKKLTAGEVVYPMSWYVDPRLGSSPGGLGGEGSALERLQQFADELSVDSTRLLFVMAEAGQGKSRVLEEFTVQQAERYLQHQTSHLALYIDAQGRGLARLDEVIAKQLNELDFLLGYNALVALVREGLIVLVIDGFDELIGSRGTFDDAFRSLSAFLEVLGGKGSLIAAGRSTYFVQEYEARGRLLSDALSYSLEQAFLKPWTHRDQDRFVQIALGATRLSEQRKAEVRAAFADFHEDAQVRDLLGRPLFARDVLFILLDGGTKPADLTADRLIPYLAGEYLRREIADKLLVGGESFLTPEQLEEYYRHLAEEMWELETRELDVADAETIIDVYADDSWKLVGQAREMARARAGKLPFLEVGETSRRVQFEHEVFFGYFLAGSLVPALQGAAGALALLGRGRLDPMTADLVVQMTPLGQEQEVLDSLSRLAQSRHPRRLQIEVNAGALAAAVLRRSSAAGKGENLILHGLLLAGEGLPGVQLTRCVLDDVRFDRVDLRGAQFTACSASRVLLEEVLVDRDSTRLELAGLDPSTDVNGLQYEEGGLLDLTFDPDKVGEILRSIGLLDDAEIGPQYSVRSDVLDRVEHIARAFRRVNPIGTNHTRFGVLLTDALGQSVVDILLRQGILAVDAPRQTRGPAQTFYRKRFDEAELMGALTAPPTDSAIDEAWRELSGL